MSKLTHTSLGLTSFFVLLGLALSVPRIAAATTQDRIVRSAGDYRDSSQDSRERDPLKLDESRTAAGHVATKSKTEDWAYLASGIFGDQWIYDAGVELYDDFDGDGYYRYLLVWLDADTYLEDTYVYAVLYLSIDGEIFEEYAATDDFLISGSSSFDEYEIETELVSGYPAGYYDVLIELYDADHGILVDEFGPVESSELSLLPLEDAEYDGAEVVVSISHGHGGGGAVSWLLLPGLLAVAMRRRWG